jgi:hypothetical protein
MTEDGLEITVGKPAAFVPSSFVPRNDGSALRFHVEVQNVGEDDFSTRHFSTRLLVRGREAQQIYDDPNAVVARVERRLAPGDMVSFDVGFWVPGPSGLQVVVSPGYDHAEVAFSG